MNSTRLWLNNDFSIILHVKNDHKHLLLHRVATSFKHINLSTRMRLRTLLKDESKHILRALEDCNIQTDEQFLYNSHSLVSLFQRLPSNVVAFSDLERVQENILRFLSTEGRSGAQLFEERPEDDLQNWSTGSSVLNHILQSTFPGVIEITGRKGSGKTVSTFPTRSNY